MKKKDKSIEQVKRENRILEFTVGVLLVLVILLTKDSLRENKFDRVEGYLCEKYYSPDNIEKAIRTKLGESVDEKDTQNEFISANFDNYMINLVLDDINKYEDEHLAKYNFYLRKEEAAGILKQIGTNQGINVEELNDICYIKICDFTKRKTYPALRKYKDLYKSKTKYIIDLRDNTGGSVDELVDVLSLFYPEGSVVYTAARGSERKELKTSCEPLIEFDKIIILCNENTASSSEMLMFNLKSDFPEKVQFVGEKTYGKNFCYSYKEFSDGELLVFVSGIMGNRLGETFDMSGIVPDYQVEEKDVLEFAKDLLK